MKQSLDDRKQSCSWSLGVSLSIAFTDEVTKKKQAYNNDGQLCFGLTHLAPIPHRAQTYYITT